MKKRDSRVSLFICDEYVNSGNTVIFLFLKLTSKNQSEE